MKTLLEKYNETYLKAYEEAKEICDRYNNFVGDQRSLAYKRLSNIVVDIYMGRMDNFGKKLGLPTYKETYHKN